MRQSKRWIEGAVILAFWCLIALVTLVRHKFDPHSVADGGLLEGEVLQTFCEYGIWAALTPLIFWMSSLLPRERGGWMRLLPLYILAGVAVSAVTDLGDHILWNALVVGGNTRPVSLTYVLSGFHALGEFALYSIILLIGLARVFLIRLQENEKEAARLQVHLAEARLQALQMQINPHFLFNTLHVISDNFEEDPSVARRMIARLSEILRYTFQETGAGEVSLAKELKFLDGYLDIQRYRFEDRLSVSCDIEPEVRDALVPNLILQPLVENAIQHGVSQLEGPGHIAVRAWLEGETLHLTVHDNGPGIMPAGGDGHHRISGGVGLRNTRERLRSLYGSDQQLSLHPHPEGGTVAQVSLPFRKKSEVAIAAADDEVPWLPKR